MRIFKPIGFFARIITKPYKHISNDVKKGSRNIKADLNELKNNIKGTEKYNYIEAKDGKEAFGILVEKNKWTDDELKTQHQSMRRAKWISMVFLWISLCCLIGVLVYANGFLYMLMGLAFTVVMMINFATRALKWCIFQTQLELKNLISFHEFWAMPDKWSRFLS